MAWLGESRFGLAGQGRHGKARHGKARRGVARQGRENPFSSERGFLLKANRKCLRKENGCAAENKEKT